MEWRQKSRLLDWRRDRNTKFFHWMAKAKAMANTMKVTMVNGRRVEGKRDLREAVMSYFTSIFAPNSEVNSSRHSTNCPATLPLDGSYSYPYAQLHPSGLEAKISPFAGTSTYLSVLNHNHAPLTPGRLETGYTFPPFQPRYPSWVVRSWGDER